MTELSTTGDPEYAQKALAAIKEEQRLSSESCKATALKVTDDLFKWMQDVAKGEIKVTEYTSNGEPYTVDGKRYLFENSAQIKALASTIEIAAGKQEVRNELHVAILSRGKEKPVKIVKGDITEIEAQIEKFE